MNTYVFYENFSLNINEVSTNGLIFSTNGRKTLARIKAGLYFYFINTDVPIRKHLKPSIWKRLLKSTKPLK